MNRKKSRKDKRQVRHRRVRKKLIGTTRAPRLSVFKSSGHIYAQIINDHESHTLVSASSLTPKIKELISADVKKKVDISAVVGKFLGELALKKGIKKVCFDRGGYPFHGRIKSFAEAARKAGMEF